MYVKLALFGRPIVTPAVWNFQKCETGTDRGPHRDSKQEKIAPHSLNKSLVLVEHGVSN